MRLLVLSSPDLVCFLPLTRGNLTKQPEWCERFMPTTTSRVWFSIHEFLPPPLLCLSPLLVLSTSSDSPSFLSPAFPDYLTARSYAYAYSYEIKKFWTFSKHIQLFQIVFFFINWRSGQTLPCRKSLRKSKEVNFGATVVSTTCSTGQGTEVNSIQ